MAHTHSHSALGIREGVVSLLLNLLLFVLKQYAGIVSGSVALIADAWHTLSDSLTSLVVIVGIRLSRQKPDKEHPFGHGRWEQISAIVIAFLLGIVGFDFVKESIDKFTSHGAADFGVLAYVATILTILVKEGLAQYAFHIARVTGNVSVKADGWHHRSDALSSVVVLVGLLISPYVWWIDGALGMVISLMLFYVAYEIVREAINKILGEEPAEEIVADVKRVVAEEMGETAYPHHFHIHNYGERKEFTFHVKVPGETTVLDAHTAATRVEKRLRTDFGMESTIHIEPLPGCPV